MTDQEYEKMFDQMIARIQARRKKRINISKPPITAGKNWGESLILRLFLWPAGKMDEMFNRIFCSAKRDNKEQS